jgi:branched-chain amino acid transport system ATP-binding protein
MEENLKLLELENITIQYGKLIAVNGLDMIIDEGQIKGLIGPNGSGKSTTFGAISGFLHPVTGRIKLGGRDITHQSPHTRAREGIARTFQLNTLFFNNTVLYNVMMARYLHCKVGLLQQMLHTPGSRKQEENAEEKSLQLLDYLGILSLKDEICGKLPHGHQRVLSIAIALATEPKLLLLDEPLTGMDPTEKKEIMGKMQKVRDTGVTILIVEHDMKSVMEYCEHITVLNFGKKIAEGTAKEVSNNKDVIEAYLGS